MTPRAAPPTIVLRPDADGIATAGELLRAGGLVAFPTETVYGLGANALDTHAVQAIFVAKQRPADDPLIVHLAAPSDLARVAQPSRMAERLMAAFWPGPLTLVLPKQARVPPEVTAGLETVAVRVPDHTLARELIQAAGVPLAAPSANLFGRPSPTRAEHVLDDLNGRIDAVLEGGPTRVGIESTIVDASSERPRLLRPGGVPAEAIEAVLGQGLLPPPTAGHVPLAPGLLTVHYAPRTPLVLIEGDPITARERLARELRTAVARGRLAGVLLLEEDADVPPPGVRVERVGSWFAPAGSAVRLFDALRALDRDGLDVLFARHLADPGAGLGRALADRLRRAAKRVIG